MRGGYTRPCHGYDARVEHRFTGPPYTIGIEEELMILDAETLDLSNSIETMLEAVQEANGQVKPELMESVLEVATNPCRNTGEAGRELRDLRTRVSQAASERGSRLGHPRAQVPQLDRKSTRLNSSH